ncbi:MAG: hypothetical protein ACVCEJ_04280 [Candidatus Izemoplasmataceae bacterium]
MNLYIESQELDDEIQSKIKEVTKHFPNVRLEEYIVVGLLNNVIILRFTNIDLEQLTLSDLSIREVAIRNIVKPNFIANFLGRDYEHFGLNIKKLTTTLHNCFNSLDVEPIIFEPIYQDRIRDDIEKLKGEIGNDVDVWEIQINDANIDVLYFDDIDNENRSLNHISFIPIKYDDSFNGIIKAMYKAVRDDLSLCEVLLAYQK